MCVVRAAREIDAAASLERAAARGHRRAGRAARPFDHRRRPRKADAPVRAGVERAAAEAKATQAANSKLAERNRSRKASSLLAVDTATSNVPALGGKATLGQ